MNAILMKLKEVENFHTMKTHFLKKLEPFLKQLQPMPVRPTDAVADCRKDETIKAVIFDIYGTLLISASGDIMQDSYDASMFSQALLGAGYTIKVPEPELMAIHPLFEQQVLNGKKQAKEAGTPFPELNLIYIWEKTLVQAEAEGLIAISDEADIRLFTILFELSSNQVWPMPGMKETLAGLKQKGYPLGIVSNAQFYTPIIMNYFLDDRLKETEWIDGFENDLSVFSYKLLKGKPDPSVFTRLVAPLEERRLAPHEVLYVGNDMLKDMYTSAQIGFKTCFFAGDQRAYRLRKNHPEASGMKPDFTITTLSQLNEIL
jgi:putative hydrolase of the HAD superfamily